jgi:hypothetical protein
MLTAQQRRKQGEEKLACWQYPGAIELSLITIPIYVLNRARNTALIIRAFWRQRDSGFRSKACSKEALRYAYRSSAE